MRNAPYSATLRLRTLTVVIEAAKDDSEFCRPHTKAGARLLSPSCYAVRPRFSRPTTLTHQAARAVGNGSGLIKIPPTPNFVSGGDPDGDGIDAEIEALAGIDLFPECEAADAGTPIDVGANKRSFWCWRANLSQTAREPGDRSIRYRTHLAREE